MRLRPPSIKPTSPSFPEAERLATAASHWHLMPSAVQVAVRDGTVSGVLRLASGSFDPLLGDGPEVPTSFTRLHDASYTGMVLIQLDQADGNLLDALVKQHDLTVLDVVHDEAGSSVCPITARRGWMNSVLKTGCAGSENFNRAGGCLPGYCTSPPVHRLWPLFQPPISVLEATLLATDMVQFGAEEASCDAWMCLAAVDRVRLGRWSNTSPTAGASSGQNLHRNFGFTMRLHGALRGFKPWPTTPTLPSAARVK